MTLKYFDENKVLISKKGIEFRKRIFILFPILFFFIGLILLLGIGYVVKVNILHKTFTIEDILLALVLLIIFIIVMVSVIFIAIRRVPSEIKIKENGFFVKYISGKTVFIKWEEVSRIDKTKYDDYVILAKPIGFPLVVYPYKYIIAVKESIGKVIEEHWKKYLTKKYGNIKIADGEKDVLEYEAF